MKKSLILMVATIMALSCGKEVVTKEVIKEAEPKLSVSCYTGRAGEIESTSAKISGIAAIVNASASNGFTAFYYSANLPSTAQSLKSANKIGAGNIGKEGGEFSVALGNLQPETTYYYVASVQIDEQEFLGKVESFTTTETPVELVTSGAATEITVMSAKISGYANPTSGMSDVVLGVMVSQNEANLDGGSVYVSGDVDDNNEFSIVASGLSSNTIYYYKSFIQYSDKQGLVCRYGEPRSFTTSVVEATVETKDAVDVSEHNATLKGKVSANEDLSKEAWFIYSKTYSTLNDLLNNGSRAIANIEEDGAIECDIKSLESGEEYFYVAVAKVYDQIIYGVVKSFSTVDITTIRTGSVTDIMYTAATLSGVLIVDTQKQITKTAGFLYSSSYASIEGLVANGKQADANIDGEILSCSLTGLKDGTTYFYLATALVNGHSVFGEEVKSFSTNAAPEGSVAMGTVMKRGDGGLYEVCWRTCNLGASKPEEIGDYYAWGETDIKGNGYYRLWGDYKLCDGTMNSLTKYNYDSEYGVVDNKMVLEDVDDAAHIKLSGTWRMPTMEELDKLIEECTWKIVTVNEVNGAQVVNNKNGNSIFIPASGVLGRSDVAGRVFCWSSSLSTRYPYNAGYLTAYYYANQDKVKTDNVVMFRTVGQPIRPVTE